MAEKVFKKITVTAGARSGGGAKLTVRLPLAEG